MQLLPHHQAVVDRFVAACQADERVLAAFLGGSYARGAADAFSDLDLYLITTDAAHADFVAGHQAFVKRLGEPVFLENFDIPDIVFYVLADGTEGELRFGRASQFSHLHHGPYQVLLDKQGLLAGTVFPEPQPERSRQVEMLRRQVYWFWHDLSHFITAFGRGQYWWAAGQLEVLRRCCVNLARLRHNFSDADVGEEAYFKVENAISIEALSALQTTFCPMEREALLQSALRTVRFYQELAPDLARIHGVDYPAELEGVMLERLEQYGG
jgi:hypothetical protein